jgi:hypothetical protein
MTQEWAYGAFAPRSLNGSLKSDAAHSARLLAAKTVIAIVTAVKLAAVKLVGKAAP